jgi:hypothetical protein
LNGPKEDRGYLRMEELSSTNLLRYLSLSRVLQLLPTLYSLILADSEANPATAKRYEERLKTRTNWTRLAGTLITSP